MHLDKLICGNLDVVCGKCAREKDSRLPLIFNERMLQEFGCNNPERRTPFVVYLLDGVPESC